MLLYENAFFDFKFEFWKPAPEEEVEKISYFRDSGSFDAINE